MRPLNYWVWFLRGRNGLAGWKSLVNWWLILHVAVGLAISYLVTATLTEAGKAVLLPMAAVFVGMSFAWVGTALSLIQTTEIESLAEQQSGGIEAYVYPFQTAILVLLTALVGWGIAGLGVFDRKCTLYCPSWGYQAVSASMYGLASLTIRECWHVVLGSQMLLLYQRAIKKAALK